MSLFAEIPGDLVWAYTMRIRSGRPYHQWELKGPRGGIHVSAHFAESEWHSDRWLGGIEAHSPIATSEYNEGRPSHDHCWLIGAPCWHDGSSLQFSEQVAPMLPYEDRQMTDYEHRAVLPVMLHRYDIWLPSLEDVATRKQEQQ